MERPNERAGDAPNVADARRRASALGEAVRLAPEDPVLRRLLADALEQAGSPDDAERELKQVLRLADANAPEPRLALARFYQRQGRAKAALVLVEDLLTDVPDPAAHRLRGELRSTLGEHEDAPVLEIVSPQAASSAMDRSRAWDSEVGEVPDRATRAAVTFADVGGMESVKEEIRLKIIHPLAHPELYAAYGKQAGGAVLLFGPPGCGKTHVARATAGEVDATFLEVGISDVLDMWVGNSEKNLHALFEQARGSTPCVLFFDEVDALAAKRRDLVASGGRQLVNQFLAELDGVVSSNAGVLVVAATNAPWHLDDAFRRPGRFDRLLFVPPPDESARASILQLQLRHRPAEGVDVAAVAAKTAGYSGADLMGLVDQAVERKLSEALKLGRPVPITTRDLLAVAAHVKPSTRDWFATARNYVLYANQGGQYDAVRVHLEQR
jgi:AAA+ superfamily predicted ATPase